MTNKEIAATIVEQLGGMGRLSAMVNARDWVALDKGLQFTFAGKRGMNKCLVHLNADDTYTLELWNCRIRKGEFINEMKYQAEGVYFDMLVDLFERHTGLYLSLGTMGR